jgi:hypothetical protein
MTLPLPGPIVPSPLTTLPDPEFSRVGLRAKTLLTQMLGGQNLFGRPRGFVTLLEVEKFFDTIDSLLALAKSIQDTISKFENEDDFARQAENALNDGIQRSAALKHDQQGQLEVVRAQKSATQNIIAALRNEIDRSQKELNESQAEFQAAVQRATSPRCTIGSVLQIVSIIVSLATGVGTLATAAVAAGSAIANHGLALSNLPGTVRAFQAIGTNIQDIEQKFATLTPVLAGQPEAALLIINEQDFDKMVSDLDTEIQNSPARDSPEASKFHTAAHRFVGLVKTRNHKIIDRDGMIIAEAALEEEIARRDAETQSLQDQLASAQRHDHKAYTSIVRGIFESNLSTLRLGMWQEVTAIELFTLSDLSGKYRFGIPRDSAMSEEYTARILLELSESQSKIKGDFLLTQADLPGEGQPLPQQIVDIPLSTEQISALAAGAPGVREIAFAISFQQFPAILTEIFVDQVDVQLLDGQSERIAFDGRLVHCGRSAFRKANGDIKVFSHVPQTFGVLSGNPGPLGLPFKATKYVGLSPFTSWTLRVDTIADPARLQNARAVRMVFQGKFRALAT